MNVQWIPALVAGGSIWSNISPSKPVSFVVLLALGAASILSWAIIFSKWSRFRKAREENARFSKAFRKAVNLDSVAVACEQYPSAPLVIVFDFGYTEFERQARERGRIANRTAIERSLQIGSSEAVGRLEQNLNWLATIATVSPFVGLLGTVWGIIDAFQALSTAGSASLRAVGPGIAEALFATAMGLAAAIPAVIFYNYFGNYMREISTRAEDFSLEFLNLIERMYEA